MERQTIQGLIPIMRSDRIEASYTFRLLPVTEQIEVVRDVPVADRYDVITLAEDATPLVQALSVPELYALVRHETLQSRVQSLLEVASPNQLQGVMDFACWENDLPDEQSAFEWIEWLMGLPDEAVRKRLSVLDAAFLGSVLGPHVEAAPENAPGEFTVIATRIMALPTGLSYDDASVEWFFYRIFEVDRTLFDELIDRIFRDDWTEYRATHGAQSDQLSEAAHLRAQRLRELELGDTYESRAELLQPLEVRLSRSSRTFDNQLPAVVPTEPMLDTLAQIVDDAETMTEWSVSLARLAGDVLMARGRDPGDAREYARAVAFTRSAVNVALDSISGGSPWFALSIVNTWGWRSLFRVGNTLIEKLRWRVDSIDENDILREEDRVLLEGLFKVPMKVYDVQTRSYRLPQFAVDLRRVHRVIHAIQFERRQ